LNQSDFSYRAPARCRAGLFDAHDTSQRLDRSNDVVVALPVDNSHTPNHPVPMLTAPPASQRELRTVASTHDLVIVGGGLAGCCCAISAARAGLRVALVQDRPVLGGNASSEVRLWTLGATAHMGNCNRWAREGGVIDELLVENLFRNPEGNALLFDALLLEFVTREPNITLLLNTACYEVTKRDADSIESVRAFCSQNSTRYDVSAPLFVDASGDGIVGFLSGAAFRMGAESPAEFDERFAPDKDFGELLGHSMYFYSKDVGKPVQFIPPSFALRDIESAIPRYKQFSLTEHGCKLWWIEFGGRLDTVHDTETIKWELWKVVYGVWNYFKNSGKFPEAANLTLEWVSTIPGKRESRRFEGDVWITQKDVVNATHLDDVVSFGGWGLDLHPADGVFSPKPGFTHWQPKSIYPMPYRAMYSKNIRNLFLAGRVISSTHVAFGSTRVMGTCAYAAQAVGAAAAICVRDGVLPRDVASGSRLRELQAHVQREGHHLPGMALRDERDLVQHATIDVSSTRTLAGFPDTGAGEPMDRSRCQMLPVAPGRMPKLAVTLDAAKPTTATIQLRACRHVNAFVPDIILATQEFKLDAGANQTIAIDFSHVTFDRDQYVYLHITGNWDLRIHTSRDRITGVLSMGFKTSQKDVESIGIDCFDLYTPARRPGGENFAMTIEPPLEPYAARDLKLGIHRPTHRPNAWVPASTDQSPAVTLRWDAPQTVRQIDIAFDADWDHPAESALWGHPEREMPFCVKRFRIVDEAGNEVARCDDHRHSRFRIALVEAIRTPVLRLELLEWRDAPPAVFAIRAYETPTGKIL
jgi:hypothetical protein